MFPFILLTGKSYMQLVQGYCVYGIHYNKEE